MRFHLLRMIYQLGEGIVPLREVCRHSFMRARVCTAPPTTVQRVDKRVSWPRENNDLRLKYRSTSPEISAFENLPIFTYTPIKIASNFEIFMNYVGALSRCAILAWPPFFFHSPRALRAHPPINVGYRDCSASYLYSR